MVKKKGGLEKGITELQFPMDHFKVESQLSWRHMKYHVE